MGRPKGRVWHILDQDMQIYIPLSCIYAGPCDICGWGIAALNAVLFDPYDPGALPRDQEAVCGPQDGRRVCLRALRRARQRQYCHAPYGDELMLWTMDWLLPQCMSYGYGLWGGVVYTAAGLWLWGIVLSPTRELAKQVCLGLKRNLGQGMRKYREQLLW
jgi:hypothetical protein